MRKHIGNESKRRGARKTMAVVLCACMMGTMLPGTVLAEEPEIVSVKLQTEPAQSTSENTVSENAPELTRPEEALQERTTAEGYDAEGFCTGYIWENGELELVLNSEGGNQCSHGDACKGYQKAALETLTYDFNGDGKTDENDKAYKITNAGQLYWFAAYVNEGGENLSSNAYLANDITVNRNLLSRIQENETTGEITNDGEFRKWVPIGDYGTNTSSKYAGVFDGGNHIIGGIYINETDKGNNGLFGYLKGSVLSLEVTDSMIRGCYNNGGIVGENAGNVETCIFRGRVIAEYTTGLSGASAKKSGRWAGGIVGNNETDGKIEKCTNYGSVTGYRSNFGGIAGDNIGEITGCVNNGDILNYNLVYDISHYGAVGGIAGGCAYYNNFQGKVTNCVNHGKVEGRKNSDGLSAYTGGIVGFNEGGKIDTCWNDGEIKGVNTGGICGDNNDYYNSGGGEILNSYNIGVIESGYGICYYTGYSDGSYVKKCYTSSSKVAYFNEQDNGIEAGYTNVYYLSVDDNGKAVETDNSSGTTAMTTAEFSSGKVAYLLQQAQEADAETGKKPLVWYQNIDNGSTKDNYPVLASTHGKVYQCLGCIGVYSNTENKTAEHVLIPNPENENTHICKNCGGAEENHQAPVLWADDASHSIVERCNECKKVLDTGRITLTAPSGSLVYDGTVKAASVTGTIKGVNTPVITYAKVAANGAETPLSGAPKDAGTYKAKITCGSGDNTATVGVTYVIEKATPKIEKAPVVAEKSYQPGALLTNADINASVAIVRGADGNILSGTWRWKEKSIIPTVNNKGYTAVFTPSDTVNYATVETTLTVTVRRAPSAPNKPETAKKVSVSTKKVGDVALPDGWTWQQTDKNKKLVAGKGITATALYTGADKGNYETVAVKITITRQKPVKGKIYQDDSGKATYKVTGSGRKGNTVAYKAPVNKNAKTVSIPATVKIGGITYKVTEIAKGAFKNSKKLQKVTIGKNVVTIGKQAFYGCKKLKTVTINTTKLTAKRVGSGAFSKTPKNMTVKVPKKKLQAYREILTQKGVKKTARFKKK